MLIRKQLLEPGGTIEPLDLISGLLGGREQLQHLHGGWSPRPDALLHSLVATIRGSSSSSSSVSGAGSRGKEAKQQAVASPAA